jgi:hypothetical protein
MPQFKRHKRLKRISSKQKFGVRYLHQHLFKDDPTSEEDSAVEDSHHLMPQKTDGRLFFVRAISGLMLLAGLVLALVGGLVKRREIDYKVHKDGNEEPVGDAVQYNSMLDALVLIGSVLIMLGGVMLAAVQILICYPRMKSGTKKPRIKDPESFLYPEKSESEVATKKFDKVPVYALVHKVQPKKKDGNKKDRTNHSLKKSKFKTSIDEEENEQTK